MDTPGFTRFWAAWPRNVQGGYARKGGKAECLKLWLRGHHETQAETIVRHVEWLKTTADWLKDSGMFIPAPAVYLRQQRWDGAEIPEAPTSSAPVDETRRYLAEQEAHRRAAKEAAQRRRAGQ